MKFCNLFLNVSVILGLMTAAYALGKDGKEGDGGDIRGIDIKAEGKILLEFVLSLDAKMQPFTEDQLNELKHILGGNVEMHFTNENTKHKASGAEKDEATVPEGAKEVVYLNRERIETALGKDVDPRSERFLRLIYHALFNVTKTIDDSGYGYSSSLATIIFPHRENIREVTKIYLHQGFPTMQACTRQTGRMPFRAINIIYNVDCGKLVDEQIGISAAWDKNFSEQFEVTEPVATKAAKVLSLDRGARSVHIGLDVGESTEAWGTLSLKVKPLGRAAVATVKFVGDFDREYTATFLCTGMPFKN